MIGTFVLEYLREVKDSDDKFERISFVKLFNKKKCMLGPKEEYQIMHKIYYYQSEANVYQCLV